MAKFTISKEDHNESKYLIKIEKRIERSCSITINSIKVISNPNNYRMSVGYLKNSKIENGTVRNELLALEQNDGYLIYKQSYQILIGEVSANDTICFEISGGSNLGEIGSFKFDIDMEQKPL